MNTINKATISVLIVAFKTTATVILMLGNLKHRLKRLRLLVGDIFNIHTCFYLTILILSVCLIMSGYWVSSLINLVR